MKKYIISIVLALLLIIPMINVYADTDSDTYYAPTFSSDSFGESYRLCSELLGDDMVLVVKGSINVLRIAAVIIAIGNAMLTLIPAVVSNDADGLKKASSKLIVMAVVLALVGVLPSIINLIAGIFGYDVTCIF